MIRRLPVLPTIIVLAAVAVMIGLGIWQLGRMDDKARQLARYEQARTFSSLAPWPRTPEQREATLFRYSELTCLRVLSRGSVAGRNYKDEAGLAVTARCAIQGGGEADIVLGWARDPQVPVHWNGGWVQGIVTGGSGDEARLIASPPVAGLGQIKPPDPKDVPNNHFAYAMQWFFFAATALVIYVLAVRRRLATPAPRG